MIDIDVPAPGRHPRRLRRLVAYPALGLSIVATVAGVAVWRGAGETAPDLTAHVAVADEAVVAGGEVRLRGVATVTNADDRVAVVHGVHADWPGVRIGTHRERAHRVPPRRTVLMGVSVTMTCVPGEVAAMPGRALVDLRGGRGEVDVPITAARPWPAMRRDACGLLRAGPPD